MNRKQGTPRPRKGFTLAELLIVVAIIAVLVAIAIPIFTSQLEKSRESVDLSNVRAAYAEVMSAAITDDGTAQYGGAVIKQGDGTFQATVSPLKQQQDDWATNVEAMELGGVPYADWNAKEPKAHGSCTVRYDPGSGKVTIDWGGAGASGGGESPGEETPSETVDIGDEIKASIQAALLNAIKGASGSHKITITVMNGEITIHNTGNPHESLSDEQVIETLKGVSGVTIDDSNRMYIDGKPVTDTVEVHYKPNSH